MVEPPIIQTDRFTLRPLRPSDADALFPTLSDPEQCLYLTRPAFPSREDLWSWLADRDWPGRSWIAVDRCGQQAGEVVGRFVAVRSHADDVFEIGYITCAHAQRRGVARECTAALIAQLWTEGARKLIAEVDTRNTPSIRLLESLGFTREATFREHEVTHAGMCDVHWYGLLKGQFCS